MAACDRLIMNLTFKRDMILCKSYLMSGFFVVKYVCDMRMHNVKQNVTKLMHSKMSRVPFEIYLPLIYYFLLISVCLMYYLLESSNFSSYYIENSYNAVM